MRSNDISKTQYRLNKISPSMCLAKWLQVTLHLHLGHNHSCHHPITHKINKKEIKDNPHALHNTSFKKEVRKEMLNGKRPAECDYCWQVEDSNESSISDRVLKSSSHWAEPYFDEVISSGDGARIKPRYLEVSFSHACNFKCSYCAPHFSSSWEKEINQFGPYMLNRVYNGTGMYSFMAKKPVALNKPNPYVKAFWDWLPDVYNDLQVLRVTGGEPLLSQDTFKLIEKIKLTPNPNLKLAINTNLGVPDKVIDRTINNLKSIKPGYHVEKLQIFTSVDTWGEQAEYIRNGLNFDKFWANLKRILLSLPAADITIMCTFNNLSVPSFKLFLQEYLKLKKEVYEQREKNAHLLLDITHLKLPSHQSVLLLPKDYAVQKIQECYQFVTDNRCVLGRWSSPYFTEHEVRKLKRILELVKNSPMHTEMKKQEMANFYKFFSEHDKRRGTDFLKTFAELKSFWQSCQSSAELTPSYPDFNKLHTAAWAVIKAKSKFEAVISSGK